MRKLFLIMSVAVLSLFMVQAAVAENCVEVDLELPDTVVAEPGTFATGFFELTNCGDEAATVMLGIDIEVNGMPFTIGDIPVYLGAGEVISREFNFPVPPLAEGYTVTFCVTATSGEFEASDCETIVVESWSGDGGDVAKTFGLTMTSENGECVEADLEMPDTVYAAPASFLEGYFEVVNCGDEAATVELSVSLDISILDTTVTLGVVPVELGAGEDISREFRFPVPPAVPNGEFGICITATSGDAVSTACQTVVVINEWTPETDKAPEGHGFNLNNRPNPFNPATTISFELDKSAEVSLDIYNVLGQKVTNLVDEYLPAGQHSYKWNSSSEGEVASGIYFYRLQVDDESVSKKMTIMK